MTEERRRAMPGHALARPAARRAVSAAAQLLLATALGAQVPAAPPLLLNHLYVVLDSATYHDILLSSYLVKAFAGNETRTGGGRFDRPSGLVLYGRHTYLEIVGPGGYPGAQPGDVGVAFSTDRPGGLGELAHRLAAINAPFDTVTKVRSDSAGTIPWVEQLRSGGVDSTSDRVLAWAMEYSQALTERVARRDSLGTEDRERDRFIAEHFDSLRLMAEITSATLAVPADDIVKLRVALAEWGASVYAEGEGAVVQFPGFTLHLLPAWEQPGGVRRLEFALTGEAPADPTFRFGAHSRLRFGPGRVAVWDFAAP